jgi:Aromatic-ring hydroxylase, C-terminal
VTSKTILQVTIKLVKESIQSRATKLTGHARRAAATWPRPCTDGPNPVTLFSATANCSTWFPGQRVPDVRISGGRNATTLHGVLRGGRHVLVVPTAYTDAVLHDPVLGPYRADLDVVTGDIGEALTPKGRGKGLAVLVRPDGHIAARGRPGGHIAARGRPGRMAAITGYLHDLFGEPAAQLPSSRKNTSVRRLAGSSSQSP